jgi:hypothetical protein
MVDFIASQGTRAVFSALFLVGGQPMSNHINPVSLLGAGTVANQINLSSICPSSLCEVM